ncbi:asparagine synthase [Streptomyces griseocarneus]|nr:asparagine synthase [Streptomyces griseocarneus]
MPGGASFTVLPDTDGALAVARALSTVPGTQVIAHASGRPWLVGHLPAGEVRLAMAGQTHVVVAGDSPVTTTELARFAECLSDLSSVAGWARRLAGCAHLLVSMAGRVHVQGTVSGVRAVFHTRLGGITVASGQPDGLARMTGAVLDEELLAVRLLSPLVPYPLRERPLWRGVHQLPPDHWLLIEPCGSSRTGRWWTPPVAELTREQGVALVRERLVEAVRGRAAACAVVSSDLSGGLDSGAVTCLAGAAAERLVTMRVAELDPGSDDTQWAGRIAGFLPDADHLLLEYGQVPTMFADLDTGAGFTLPGEPVSWVRTGARFADICRRAAALGSGLHLCGHGGDELFHLAPAHVHSLVRSHPWAGLRYARGRRAMAHWTTMATWRALSDQRSFPAWLAHTAQTLRAGQPSPYQPRLGWTAPLRLPAWVSDDAADAVRRLLLAAAQENPEPLDAGRGPHTTMDAIRTAGTMIRQTSQIAAAHGVQLAAPYLDDRVIEAALAVRPDERSSPSRYKPLLAEAMRGLVPDSLLDRRTKGNFGEDSYDGLRRHHATLLELFNGSELAHHGLVDDHRVQAGLRTAHPMLAGIPLEPTLACETWLRSHTRPAPAPPATPQGAA